MRASCLLSIGLGQFLQEGFLRTNPSEPGEWPTLVNPSTSEQNVQGMSNVQMAHTHRIHTGSGYAGEQATLQALLNHRVLLPVKNPERAFLVLVLVGFSGRVDLRLPLRR